MANIPNYSNVNYTQAILRLRFYSIYSDCRSAYSASKHALQAFMDSLRAEVASEGVNVTVVSPGYIKTNLSENAVTGSGSKYGGELRLIIG